MATKTDISRQRSVKQENAVDLLVTGKTDTEVAEAVGVTRQTVNEWKNHDPVFVAALNERREELWRSGREHLRSLVVQAVKTLENDLNGPDPKLRQLAAVHVLKAVGMYGKQNFSPCGAVTPEGVEGEWKRLQDSARLFEGLLGCL
ncbi:MAG: phBC6A51 family helix-turn-helix protein [Candidatus Bipolaricaulis sp.]|nr:phBC6A51 family helix-turn-helix protein [Candidatus Bipolaricaulis sp.]